MVKEAQATPLRDVFLELIGKERLEWINELAPLTIAWPDGEKLKLLYPDEPRDEDGEPNSPELQVKLHETFAAQRPSAHLRRPVAGQALALLARWQTNRIHVQLARLQDQHLPEAQERPATEVPCVELVLIISMTGVALTMGAASSTVESV